MSGFFIQTFKSEHKPPKIEKHTFLYLKVGNMVTYELEDYQVVGKMVLDDRGFKWYEYQLEGMNKTYWLNAELDDELELSLYEKIKEKVNQPIPETLNIDGIHYEWMKRKAQVNGEGRVGR